MRHPETNRLLVLCSLFGLLVASACQPAEPLSSGANPPSAEAAALDAQFSLFDCNDPASYETKEGTLHCESQEGNLVGREKVAPFIVLAWGVRAGVYAYRAYSASRTVATVAVAGGRSVALTQSAADAIAGGAGVTGVLLGMGLSARDVGRVRAEARAKGRTRSCSCPLRDNFRNQNAPAHCPGRLRASVSGNKSHGDCVRAARAQAPQECQPFYGHCDRR